MKTPIDLGYNMDSGPTSVSANKTMYPNLHLEWPSDYDLPDSGELTVKFVKTGESKSKRGSKPLYTVDLEIKSIESVEAGEEEGETEEEDGSAALDRHMKDKMAESDEGY